MWVWAGLVEKVRSNMVQKSYYTSDKYVILFFNNMSLLQVQYSVMNSP